MAFKFSNRSLNNLVGVHPDLIQVMTETLAVSSVDFGIIEGVRTGSRQHELFLSGETQLDWPTPSGKLTGRHLTGHAVDYAAWSAGSLTFDEALLRKIADAAKIAALHLKIPIIWGGDWKGFVDADHIELDRTWYPDEPLIS